MLLLRFNCPAEAESHRKILLDVEKRIYFFYGRLFSYNKDRCLNYCRYKKVCSDSFEHLFFPSFSRRREIDKTYICDKLFTSSGHTINNQEEKSVI